MKNIFVKWWYKRLFLKVYFTYLKRLKYPGDALSLALRDIDEIKRGV